MKKYLVIILFILGACVPSAPEPTLIPEPTATVSPVAFEFDDVTITLQQLPGWDVYVNTGNHLIMAEGDDPFRTSGGLKGLLVNIWVPTLSNINVEYDLEKHSIAEILNLVLRTSNEKSENVVHEDPIPFDWGGHQAAYYTLTNDNGNLSLILALKVADEHFIAVNISAPSGHDHRIRETLPLLFNPLHINGKELGNDGLANLPETLAFPILTPVSPTG